MFLDLTENLARTPTEGILHFRAGCSLRRHSQQLNELILAPGDPESLRRLLLSGLAGSGGQVFAFRAHCLNLKVFERELSFFGLLLNDVDE